MPSNNSPFFGTGPFSKEQPPTSDTKTDKDNQQWFLGKVQCYGTVTGSLYIEPSDGGELVTCEIAQEIVEKKRFLRKRQESNEWPIKFTREPGRATEAVEVDWASAADAPAQSEGAAGSCTRPEE